MYKSKYTTVETQNASEGLSNGLDKAKERISNPEGMVKDISKIERQRKDQNKQTNRRYKNCGTITKGNIHAFKTITALTSLDSCQTSNQRSRELEQGKLYHSQASGNQRRSLERRTHIHTEEQIRITINFSPKGSKQESEGNM